VVTPPQGRGDRGAYVSAPRLHRALDGFIGTTRLISRLCGYVAAGLIGLGVAVVCHMVFVRYALNQNTIWQTDFVTYSLIAATFVGSPYVLMTRGHVNVDVLPLYAGPRWRWRLALFAAVASLAFSVTLAVLTFAFWKQAWDNQWVSDTMWRARLWIPYASMPIGLGVLSLQSLADLFGLVSGREPPFGIVASGRRA
jgi:TRAP-type C4-dicarboxylate transport system permease small subunit